jgi:large subunit ribosomal protein L5
MQNKRFKDVYLIEAVKQLQDTFKYKNIHQIPKIQKVVLNMGVAESVSNSKAIDVSSKDLAMISGQKPFITKAKKSIAAFKLRQGMKIGCKVTLRGDRMYDFLERLVYTSLPRIKDFKGFSIKNFDGSGNFNFGIRDQSVFPELKYDEVSSIKGLNISIVTNTNSCIQSKLLLSILKFPFLT